MGRPVGQIVKGLFIPMEPVTSRPACSTVYFIKVLSRVIFNTRSTCNERTRFRLLDLVADTGSALSLSVMVFLNCCYTYIPVCDAVALGTFRTRLETRTKESSMCASHWD